MIRLKFPNSDAKYDMQERMTRANLGSANLGSVCLGLFMDIGTCYEEDFREKVLPSLSTNDLLSLGIERFPGDREFALLSSVADSAEREYTFARR